MLLYALCNLQQAGILIYLDITHSVFTYKTQGKPNH